MKLLKKITCWAYVKNNLQLCIQRKGSEDIVKKDFLDMEVYVRVNVGNGGSYKVKSQHLQLFGVSEEELFEKAFNLTKETIKIADMTKLMLEVMGINGDELQIPKEDIMLVLTNEQRLNGAIAMYDTSLLSSIADNYDSNLVVLPSSIHECIIRLDDDPDMDIYNSMVNEVNETQLVPEEVLGDHAYFFNRETGKLEY